MSTEYLVKRGSVTVAQQGADGRWTERATVRTGETCAVHPDEAAQLVKLGVIELVSPEKPVDGKGKKAQGEEPRK
ncbi:hypothetical protein LZC95_08005 [Pendulispora brunnea]|uniref:Hypervirulence associated protein TUDOR domain-containing protein n=1 Tax=Pendulispora brunnea TaxID=2905690 RepID=A0ABZ2KDK3_9BACT